MERGEDVSGRPDHSVPEELSLFAFLIGKWQGEAKLKVEAGAWEAFTAIWKGQYILDGSAIADEYRMMTAAGKLLVLGMNFRSYDERRKSWNLKWLDALSGCWTDLGPEELGGVASDGKTITYLMKEPVARHALTRATYANISADHFTWLGDRSDDGKIWEQFLVIELHRAGD